MKKKLSKREQKEELTAFAFVLPQYIGIICFVMIPLIMSVVLCFTNWDFLGEIEFVGLKNFMTIFSKTRLATALKNTFLFALGVIPITITVSLGLALLVNEKLKGLNFYKASFFLPMTTASVAVTLVWYWLFSPNIGIINYLLNLIGVEGPRWLITNTSSRWAIIIMSVWQNMGYYFLIFFAGLKGIPADYYEVASLDGANKVHQFFKITLPLLSPTMFFVIITLSINIFNLFQEPSVLTNGGPEYSTYTVVMYIYDLAFKYFRLGEAAVVSMVMFVFITLVTILQFKISKKWVYTDED